MEDLSPIDNFNRPNRVCCSTVQINFGRNQQRRRQSRFWQKTAKIRWDIVGFDDLIKSSKISWQIGRNLLDPVENSSDLARSCQIWLRFYWSLVGFLICSGVKGEKPNSICQNRIMLSPTTTATESDWFWSGHLCGLVCQIPWTALV